MTYNLKEVKFVKYKGKVFPLNGADLNDVLVPMLLFLKINDENS